MKFNRREFMQISVIASLSFQEFLKLIQNKELKWEDVAKKFDKKIEDSDWEQQINKIENRFRESNYEIKLEKILGKNKCLNIPLDLLWVAIYGKEANKERAKEIIEEYLKNNEQAFLKSGLPNSPRRRSAKKLKLSVQEKLEQEGEIDDEGKTYMIYPMDAFTSLLNYALSLKSIWDELNKKEQIKITAPK